MGFAYIPSQTISEIEVGTTTVASPYVMIVINGIAYPNGYRITYSGGFRNFYGAYDSSTNKVYVRCHTVAYGEDLPAFTLSNVEVLIIG